MVKEESPKLGGIKMMFRYSILMFSIVVGLIANPKVNIGQMQKLDELNLYSTTQTASVKVKTVTCKNSQQLINRLHNLKEVKNLVINLVEGVTYEIPDQIRINNASNVVIKGNGAIIDGCISFQGNYCKDVTIENVIFKTNKNVNQLAFVTYIEDVYVSGCDFYQNSADYGGSSNGLLYFNSDLGAKSLKVENCYFTSDANTKQKAGIKLKGHTEGGQIENVVIEGCVFEKIHGMGIEVHENAKKIRILDCRFTELLKGSGGAIPISTVGVSDVKIQNCYCKDTSWGVEFAGDNLTMSQCSFYDIGWYFIAFTQKAEDIIVENCIFSNSPQEPMQIGFVGADYLRKNITFRNCTMYNVWFELVASNLDVALENVSIVDCSIRLATETFFSASKSIVRNIVFWNNTINYNQQGDLSSVIALNSRQDASEIIFAGNYLKKMKADSEPEKDFILMDNEYYYTEDDKVTRPEYESERELSKDKGKSGIEIAIDISKQEITEGSQLVLRTEGDDADSGTFLYGIYTIPISYRSVANNTLAPEISLTSMGNISITSAVDGEQIILDVVFERENNIQCTVEGQDLEITRVTRID